MEMIIVYISIGLIALALIWFLVQVVQFIKGARQNIVHMAKKAETVREKTETAKKEQTSAVEHIQGLNGMTKKSKDQVQFTIDQGKEIVTTFQESGNHVKKAVNQRLRRVK